MASERLGASFSIDVTNLKAGLAQANRMIRESESEFKKAAAGLDDWSKSEAGVTAKIRSLNEITDIQRKKVAALQTEYKNLIAKGLDPTSREAVELRTKINQEEAALASNEKELKRQREALKHVGDESEKAGDKITKMGGMAQAAGKAAAAAFAAAAAAVGALLKTSIQGYAEYEQLVGGVETLFGAGGKSLEEYAASVGKSVDEAKGEYEKLMSAQNTMLDNANNAYMTAGMSANEYMQNVTGFSASLISSLGGDTQKAASVADRAMRDISDNANKMGTDMQSIVDTYQSLARGNFQMLDNLKLGYGGSKAELERLIADTAKMTAVQKELNVTVKAGDTSFANIVNAISVAQKNMGITGTTTKEASTTIQGSIGMMKAAWSNLATGMSDETADIDKLIENFLDSVGSVADNLLPRIQVALNGIIKMIEKTLPKIPQLLQQFLPLLIDGIMNLLHGVVEILPQVIDTIMDVIPQLLTELINALPEILQTIVDMIVTIVNKLAEMIPFIVDAIMDIIPVLIDSLIAAIPELLQAAITLLMAIIEAIPVIIDRLLEALPGIIDTIINSLIDNMPLVTQGAIQLFMGIIKAIPTILASLSENLPTIILHIVEGLLEGIPQLIECGGELLLGLVKGMLDPRSIWNAVKGLFNGIVGGIKKLFGIASPSKVMEEMVGKNLALGIGVGFEKNMAKVNKQISNAVQLDDVGINARVSGSMNAAAGGAGKTVVVYQTNNYSQAHSRYEIYKSKQQTAAAVQLALAGV